MRLIDMDTHFAPVDEFAYVADDLKYYTPAWLPHGEGRVALVTPASEPVKRTGSHAASRRIPGDFDPDVRLRDMDAMGVERQLLNPEFGAYSFDVEPRLAAEMCRSANYAVGNVLKAHPDRFIGSAVIPTQSVKASVEEAERALDAGFQTFFMKSAQGGKNFDDQHFWPLWDFANEHNIPFSVHANGRDRGTVIDAMRTGPSWGFFVATLANFSLGSKDQVLQQLSVARRLSFIRFELESQLARVRKLASAPEPAADTGDGGGDRAGGRAKTRRNAALDVMRAAGAIDEHEIIALDAQRNARRNI